MLRCLWRARRASRKQHGARADTWVFASTIGHVRGDSLTRHGVMANHSLRRAYATAATNAGVDEDTVGKLLNHGGRSVTSRYIKTSYLGRMLAAAQEDISAHLVKALVAAWDGVNAGLWLRADGLRQQFSNRQTRRSAPASSELGQLRTYAAHKRLRSRRGHYVY